MLADGLPSSFRRINVPAVAVYGIFAPLTVISWFVREVVSTRADAAAVGEDPAASGFGGAVCAARKASEAQVKRKKFFICRCSDYPQLAGSGRRLCQPA